MQTNKVLIWRKTFISVKYDESCNLAFYCDLANVISIIKIFVKNPYLMVILSRSSNTRILCMYKVLAYFPSIFILHILWRWYSFIFLIDFLLLGFWLDMYIFFSYSYSKLDDIKSHIQYCTNDDAPQKIDYGKVYPEEVIYDLVIHIYRCTYT